MLLVVTHSLEEPVSKKLSLLKDCLPIEIVTTQQILDAHSIQDQIDRYSTTINWHLKDGRRFTNSSDTLILNRILYYAPQMYESFTPEDQFYVRREFEAYLGFALNSFPKSLQKTLPNGFIKNGFLSLPKLWSISRKLGATVPKFHFGVKTKNSMVNLDSTKLISTSLFNYSQWRPSNSDEGSLCVERPIGFPFFISRFGDIQHTWQPQTNEPSTGFPLQSDSHLGPSHVPQTEYANDNNDWPNWNPGVLQDALHLERLIVSQLGLYIAESLFFYNPSNTSITYALTTSTLSAKALQNCEFNDKIDQKILGLCNNSIQTDFIYA